MTSTGEKIDNPKKLQPNRAWLGRARRGVMRILAARLQERIASQRKGRHHKMSRRVVEENAIISSSKDNLLRLSRAGFGKSMALASHRLLRSMLNYMSRAGASQYIDVPGRGPTRTRSRCLAPTEPIGREGLSVDKWVCSVYGTLHDGDIIASINSLATWS
jgi:putative transposase